MSKKNEDIVSDLTITNKIHVIRAQNVMLDSDLADLYEVDTKRLNEQVKRNIDRFPEDFMFQLDSKEWENLKSHFATSSWGGRRTLPYVFTEHGVLMLSSVLNSQRAIDVNIRIMRVYTKIKKILQGNSELLLRMEKLETVANRHDMQISQIFKLVKQLISNNDEPRERIGFKK